MTSKDDDTLPLPGLSEEFSSEITPDEDFIPTSQPQSTESSKMSKCSEMSISKIEEVKCLIDSKIDDTLPREAIINQSLLDNDKSTDFIPDTETKKAKIIYLNQDLSCRKKLPVLSTEDLFKVESKPSWNARESEIPESPALETQNFSILNETPTAVLVTNQKCEESVTEIIVNDSAETVDLEATPVKIRNSEGEGVVKLEISSSSNSEGERSEETQILDNSSVLLLDQPGDQKVENVSELADGRPNHGEGTLQGKADDCNPISSPPSTLKTSKTIDAAKKTANVLPIQEVNLSCLEPNGGSVVTRKVDFKITVNCLVTINTKTNKVLQKIILNVNETAKPKPKPKDFESDNTSDKSKRFSSSSSGSVYSDKMGPFALPKRLSVISDQTDSSEEDFSLRLKAGSRALERVPWSNEYLLPLKMDDMMMVSIENQEFLKRQTLMSPPKRHQNRHCNGVNHLKEILESSTSEPTSCNSTTDVLNAVEETRKNLKNSEVSEREIPEGADPLEENESLKESTEPSDNIKKDELDEKEEQGASETSVQPEPKQPDVGIPSKQPEDKEEEEKEEEGSSVRLRTGLPVLARWTDKRYYSGVLCEILKNDRWDVKFDDGTAKAVREDLVMPAEWLQVGALVFAIVDDKYVSGQIVDVKKGEELTYVVELDTKKMEVSVKLSDLCLTDVMAGIIREKYKPLGGTPRGKADIDFDNVLSGKRLREQRTPLRPVTVQSGNSGSRKKSSSKAKKDESSGLHSIKENETKGDTEEKMGGLKSENGHLVEDKVISADSPSGAETGETPLRRNSKEGRKRAKPRSLSYEGERIQGKKKSKTWLATDGTPIPGTSGVKFKKQKTKTTAKELETSAGKDEEETKPFKKSSGKSKAPQSTEKGKKKRKLDEFVDDVFQKKSSKEGEGRKRTRSRKG